MNISIVIPARNEAISLKTLLPRISSLGLASEVIVVDDGSTDETAQVSTQHGARVIHHPYGMGNGAAVKSGIRATTGDVVVLMDADGQHDPTDIPRLLAKLEEGFDMVVGARNAESQASIGRLAANTFYNRIASWMTGHPIMDLTSGFRAAHTEKLREFLHLLPNGFSYPTTVTMAFFRSGFPVAYLPITAAERIGKSHIKPIRDGIRFILIIFRIGTLYSPLKLFLPISLIFFLLGAAHYIQTFILTGRFTNMSALMLSISVIVLLIGLVSEQITQLMYQPRSIPADSIHISPPVDPGRTE
jgi:glycosyltransferase involved in cell wall biosynthesis